MVNHASRLDTQLHLAEETFLSSDLYERKYKKKPFTRPRQSSKCKRQSHHLRMTWRRNLATKSWTLLDLLGKCLYSGKSTCVPLTSCRITPSPKSPACVFAGFYFLEKKAKVGRSGDQSSLGTWRMDIHCGDARQKRA